MVRASNLILTVIAAFLSMTAAYSAANILRKTSLTMNAWGAQQKVGQSVITTTSLNKTALDGLKNFTRRPPRGSGFDERLHSETDEETANMVSSVDKSFRQQALLKCLQSDAVSDVVRLERVHLASSVQGILFAPSKTGTVLAGGLLSEWDFDLKY
jgi:hypothetical protein